MQVDFELIFCSKCYFLFSKEMTDDADYLFQKVFQLVLPMRDSMCFYRMRQHNFLFYNAWQSGCRISSGVGVFSFQRRDSKVFLEIQSVTIMRWSSEERTFAVEAYFLNQLSVISNRFNVAQRDPVPDWKSIVTWVTTFKQTGSTTQRRNGIPRPIRSSENMQAVRASILQSP